MGINWSEFLVFSLYCDNIPKEVRTYQAKVFEKFQVPLQQLRVAPSGPIQESMMIGTAIEQVVEANKDRFKYFLSFDIDCIPLSKEALEYYVSEIKAGKLIGCAMRSNHIENGKHVFAAPCALGFSSELYKACTSYTTGDGHVLSMFKPTMRSDTAEEFTWAIRDKNRLNILRPTNVEKLIWPLENQNKLEYGEGTTYGLKGRPVNNAKIDVPLVYHAFNSRHGASGSRFIDKCREVLGYGKQPYFTVVMPVGRSLEVAEKAINSVVQQDINEYIQLLIVVDRPEHHIDLDLFADKFEVSDSISVDIMDLPYNSYTSGLGSTGGIPRCIGSALAKGKYVCFLDDDNEYRQNHLSSLKTTIKQTNANFIYSLRDLYDGDRFICQDDFESLGPDAGISAASGGLIDTNCMCIEKFTLWNIFGGWLSPMREEDRWIVRNAKGMKAKFACTDDSTVKYKLPDFLINNDNYWAARDAYLKRSK